MHDGVANYFGSTSRREKPLYKVVARQGVQDFINDVNDFIKNNPNYELSNDPMHFRTENHNMALFKLKQKTNKTKVKE